jgi:hypothetical protein
VRGNWQVATRKRGGVKGEYLGPNGRSRLRTGTFRAPIGSRGTGAALFRPMLARTGSPSPNPRAGTRVGFPSKSPHAGKIPTTDMVFLPVKNVNVKRNVTVIGRLTRTVLPGSAPVILAESPASTKVALADNGALQFQKLAWSSRVC